jgi:hypothetical protein
MKRRITIHAEADYSSLAVVEVSFDNPLIYEGVKKGIEREFQNAKIREFDVTPNEQRANPEAGEAAH